MQFLSEESISGRVKIDIIKTFRRRPSVIFLESTFILPLYLPPSLDGDPLVRHRSYRSYIYIEGNHLRRKDGEKLKRTLPVRVLERRPFGFL